ncbi:hypothetical protein RJT34_32423 [Clitoria ternatea]|uniref:F-box protein At3g26010-like beta-propeller domain-containing protein n=1 Tax=Clitoria ternatea TaxID=43366 RepID=A0AAN9EW01_CLITE
MMDNNLSDDILLEIWSRVPCKIAVRSMSLSKRFLALISQPHFIQRSIYHHHTLMKKEDHQNQYHFNFASKHHLLILFSPSFHFSSNPQTTQNQNQLSLSFLGPPFDPNDVTTQKEDTLYTRIVSSSNGLLLCKKFEQDRVYLLCNPITKDSVNLPPFPPFTGQNRRDRVLEGFVCEPYYHVEGKKVTLSSPRFRVVRIPCFVGTLNEFLYGITRYEFDVVVFTSETGKWTRKRVSCQKGFTQINIWVPGVAHEGKLYFMGKTSLLVYDPFNSDQQCDTIDYPTNLYQRGIPFKCYVGVCCGNIRISSVFYRSTTPNRPLSACLSVWEMGQGSLWSLVHNTYLPRLKQRDCLRPELGPVDLGAGMQVRAFHPYHGDVVFFQYAHRIFFGNLKTNQFDTDGYGNHGFQSLQIVPLDLPLWPTPLPSMP